MNNIVTALFGMIMNLAMFLLFLRFFMQLASLSRHDPMIAPFYQVTGIVDLFANIFPDLAKGRCSTATIILLFVVSSISLWGMTIISGQHLSPIQMFTGATFGFLLEFISACQWLLIAMVVVSWIMLLSQNMHPMFAIIMRMADPIIAPFRRITPNLGMLDLSPMIAIFALWMLEEIVITLMKSL